MQDLSHFEDTITQADRIVLALLVFKFLFSIVLQCSMQQGAAAQVLPSPALQNHLCQTSQVSDMK